MAIRNKTLIIGVGRLGSGIANRASSRGEDVIVIDPEPSALARLDDTFNGFKVAASATDLFALEHNCEVKTVMKAAIVTGDDNLNLFLAHLLSTVYEVPNIIVRFNDPDNGPLVKELPGVRTIYPFDLSLEKFGEIDNQGEDK